jgi:ATP-dependent Clp protease protease subunit
MPVGVKRSQRKTKKKASKRRSRKRRERVGLLICGELCDETIKTVWDNYGDDKEFLLTLCSPGGDITVYHALLDFLEIAKEEGRLATLAMGECFSGAPLLVAGGSPGKRYSYKSTLFGLHEPFLSHIPNDPGAQVAILEHLESVKKQYYQFLSSLTNHRAKWWEERIRGKSMWHMSAREAKKLGLIDEVL